MSRLRGALHVVEYDLLVYRRTWLGSLMVSFVSPLLFLAAMGVGLGDLVHRGAGSVQGVRYIEFLAPGLLAATAMQTSAGEMSYPIMGKVVWLRIYEGMLATPLRVADLLGGEIAWLTLRLWVVSSVFVGAMATFGLVRSPLTLLAVPAAMATGLAFGIPILAFAATRRKDGAFAGLQRFVVIPLFLLSGPFFPIEQLPRVLQGVAWTAPLSHGVALTRDIVLGTASAPGTLLHSAVLATYAVAGALVARHTLHRRLVT